MKRTLRRLLQILVPMLLVTGTAWAQVGSSGTVLGCVGSSGKLTAVDETTGSCKPGDVTLSWYTKDGAQAVFLGKTAKAADADRLDGLDSTHFIATGTPAGGALTGTYPSPSIAAAAVDSNAIQPGAVTAEKLAADVALRSVGSSPFIPGPGELTPVIACGEFFKDIGSVPVTVMSPSGIYAAASVNWSHGATAMGRLTIRAFLHDVSGTRVAQTPLEGIAKAEPNEPSSVNSSGVLLDENDRHPFVAAPGAYTLHLVASPEGSCQTNQETSSVTLLQNSLTYILLAPTE